ncbi:MAG: TonB-dependent receptor [Caulobacteraceae bacterium]
MNRGWSPGIVPAFSALVGAIVSIAHHWFESPRGGPVARIPDKGSNDSHSGVSTSSRALSLWGAALVLALAAPSIVNAQTADRAPAGTQQVSAEPTTVGTIVVTAEKRAEDIRDIPASVYAISGQALSANGPIMTAGDLLMTVPGVRFNGLGSPLLEEISIRGSGSERADAADSGVGLFVDGAYVGSTNAGRGFEPLDYFDLDRIEVIEGTQSALYGRDAEYGIVDLIHAKPEFKDSGYVDDAFTGGLDRNQVSAVVNHAISDDLAIRLGVQDISQTRGFFYNPDLNKHPDSQNGWIGRAQIRYRHGPLDVDLELGAQDITGPAFVGSFDIAPGTIAAVPLGLVQPEYVIAHNGNDYLKEKLANAFLLADYKFSWATLTSTTMVRSYSGRLGYDTDGVDLAQEAELQSLHETGVWPFGQGDFHPRNTSAYEDLHLGGAAFQHRLNWLFGVEILAVHDSANTQLTTSPCTFKLGAGICAGTPTAPLCLLVLRTSTPCPATFPLPFGTNEASEDDYNSEAAYADVSYEILSGLTVDGGLRYSYDDRRGNDQTYNLYTTTLSGPPSSPSLKGGAWSYSLTLSYLIPHSWHDLLYAKLGSAYRVGGLNFGIANPAAPAPLVPFYGDEYTTSYEAGLKGDITPNVYFTLATYYSRTRDVIAEVSDGCSPLNACGVRATTFNVNAGRAHAGGVELSMSSDFQLGGGRLSLHATGADQTASYYSLTPALIGGPLLGSPVPENPHWTASATVDYRHVLSEEVTGFFHLQYRGQWGGAQDTVTATLPYFELSTENIFDLRAGLDFKRFEAALVIQNLTNQNFRILQNVQRSAAGGVVLTTARWNEPRTFGVDLTYRW